MLNCNWINLSLTTELIATVMLVKSPNLSEATIMLSEISFACMSLQSCESNHDWKPWSIVRIFWMEANWTLTNFVTFSRFTAIFFHNGTEVSGSEFLIACCKTQHGIAQPILEIKLQIIGAKFCNTKHKSIMSMTHVNSSQHNLIFSLSKWKNILFA